MSQKIAGMSGIRVALVLDPDKAFLASIVLDLATRRFKKGTQNPKSGAVGESAHHRHGSSPADTGAPQKIKEQRFCLIVTMMRKDQPFGRHFRKDSVSGTTRSALQTFTAITIHVHPFHVERNTQCLAQALAECLPAI